MHFANGLGQPVLIGGTMGTCSYVLTGTQRGMEETFGSTCHGAGRAQSRNKSRRNLSYQEVTYNFRLPSNPTIFTCCIAVLAGAG